MSHKKSLSKYMDNTINNRQIVIHQRAFFYYKLWFSFLFGPSEKFKRKVTDTFFYV